MAKKQRLTIIDKIKDPSPIMVRKEKPLFRTTYEKEKWWAEEKKRCLEGYNNLPGTFYFYNQHCQIKNRQSGATEYPIARDLDLMIFEAIESNWKRGVVSGIIKGRGQGLSTIGGALTNYFMWAHPGSKSLITSKDGKGIEMMFTEKIMATYERLDEDIKPIEKRRNETKQQSFFRGEVYFKNKEGKVDVGISSVICNETSETPRSPTAFSGQGAIFGFYDEFPLHTRNRELLLSSIECYKHEGKMKGMLVWGGTVEAQLTNEQIAKFEKLVKVSEQYKTDIIFLPYWMGKNMVNGHSNEKLGRQQWEEELEGLERINDEDGIRAFKKNNPWTLEDIFALGKGSRWEDDVSDKINFQLQEVKKNPPPLTICKLVDTTKGVDTFVHKDGKVMILENPKEGELYGVMADGIATGTKVGDEKGSKAAFIVCKLQTKNGELYPSYSPVALYLDKPKTVEESYLQGTSLAKYYNKFGGLKFIAPEANAATIDHYSTYLTKEGMFRYLQRKRDLSGKGYVNTKKIGQYIGDNEREWQMRQANVFLRKHIECIKLIPLLEAMLTGVEDNADVLDAWLMFFIAMGADFDKPKVVEKQYEHEVRVLTKLPNGKVVWEYKKQIIKINQ